MSAYTDARRGAFFAALAVPWLLFCAFVVAEYLPANPFTPNVPADARVAVRQLVPQGWGFFTKSPRDEQIHLYRVTGAAYADAFAGHESEARNLFGLSRRPRMQGRELGAITAHASVSIACDADLQSCLNRARHSRENVVTTGAKAQLCGEFVMTRQAPIPFAWAHFASVSLPGQYTHVEIRCAT